MNLVKIKNQIWIIYVDLSKEGSLFKDYRIIFTILYDTYGIVHNAKIL